ncbi:unnamed protein product [Leuciscus chuanchicus]
MSLKPDRQTGPAEELLVLEQTHKVIVFISTGELSLRSEDRRTICSYTLARIEQDLKESIRREEKRQQELNQVRQEENRIRWRSLSFLSLNQRTANPVHSGTRVHMSSPALAGSTPWHTLTWASQVDNMHLCTSSEGGTPPSVAQHDLPNILPTPGREIQEVTARVQGNWDTLFDLMARQERRVNELTQEVKDTSSHHQSQIADLAAKVEDNKNQVLTLFTTTKQQEESEADNLTKAMKLMITEEIQKVESTLVSELQLMVDQLQAEVQQDIRAVQHTFQTSHKITSQLQQCVTQTDQCLTGFKELKSEVEKGFQSVKKKSRSTKVKCIDTTRSQHYQYFIPAISFYSSDSFNFFNPSFNICG